MDENTTMHSGAIKRFFVGDAVASRGRIDAPFGQVLFFVAFGVWLLAQLLWRSWSIHPIAEVVQLRTIRHICLGILLARELLYGRRDLRSLIGFGVSAFFVWIAYSIGQSSYFDTVCFIFAARDIPFRRIAKFCFAVMSIVIAVVVITALLGITLDITFGDSSSPRGVRHALGFSHPNNVPTFSFFVFCLWAYLRGNHFNLADALGILAIEGFLFYYTDSRAALVAVVMLVAFMLLFRIMPASWKSSQILKVILVGSVLFFAAFTLVVCFIYDPEVAWMVRIDSILSGRIHLAHDTFMEFGTSLFGQRVPWGSGSSYDPFTGQWSKGDPNHIVDNMYMCILIHCGVLYLVGGLAIATASMKRLYDQEELPLLLAIFVMAVHALVEGCAAYLPYNPSLFLLAILMVPKPFHAGEASPSPGETDDSSGETSNLARSDQ